MNKRNNNNQKCYALYHGDDFIDLGNKKYLADLIKVKEKTITFYMSPSWLKRTNYNGWIVIHIKE